MTALIRRTCSLLTVLAMASCMPKETQDPFTGSQIVAHLKTEHGITVAYQLPADVLLTRTGNEVKAEITAAGKNLVAPKLQESLLANWPKGPLTSAEFESAIEHYDGAIEASGAMAPQ